MAISTQIKAVPAGQCEIPRTSPTRYISGLYALNVRAPEGTTGDWHDVYHWRAGIDNPRKVTLAGDGTEIDTNPIWGNFGVYEGKSKLIQSGLIVGADIERVYIANHFRAILDLLYYSLKKYGEVHNLSGAANDWLDTQKQKELLLGKAEQLSDIFDGKSLVALLNWVDGEREPDWRSAMK